MPHIHFSVQSGDNLILKRMKRRHNRDKVIQLCEDIINARNETTFGADLIVGFPTENLSQFKNTLNLISVCKFNNVHIFPFSPKNGTPAAKMPLLNSKEISSRANEARIHSRNILKKLMKTKLGQNKKILLRILKQVIQIIFIRLVLIQKKN